MGESLASAVRAFGLTAMEWHVVVERVRGRSHQDIAGDVEMRKPKGSTYTRQAVKQIEQRAMRKLSLTWSIEDIVQRAERADAELQMRERGRLAIADVCLEERELRESQQSFSSRVRERLTPDEVRHERMVRHFLRHTLAA